MERHMNRAERRQRHKYTKYKKCLGKVILKCIKPFLPVFPFDLPENIRKIWYGCIPVNFAKFLRTPFT